MLVVLSFFFANLLLPLHAFAAELPALTGRVVDAADIIDASSRVR